MSILDRSSLEQSSLADLHAIASELSIDSFRRLRKSELIDAILERQSPTAPEEDEEVLDADQLAGAVEEELRAREDDARPSRRRRLRRGRRRDSDEDGEGSPERPEASGPPAAPAAPEAPEAEAEADGKPAGRAKDPGEQAKPSRSSAPAERPDEDLVEGVIEVLAGGSGFVRVHPPDPSDDDVYVSAAQIRRCELVSGDRVSGPRRPPRRSERFASLVRIDSVNGSPASELTDAGRFDDLPVAWPDQPLPLGDADPSLAALLAAVPLGRGSRVTIAGPPQSGKTELLRRLASALSGREDLEVKVVLAGVRPEEISEWPDGLVSPSGTLAMGSSADARSQAVEAAVEQARRLAVRGSHSVVLIDTLDGLHEGAARKALAAARSIVDGGSATVIATAAHPLGGETAVVALSPLLAAAGRWPAIDLLRSWTARPERLVGEERAQEIGRLRAQALDG